MWLIPFDPNRATLRRSPLPMHRYSVHAPLNGHFANSNPWYQPSVLSPQGDRLAWLIVREYTPPGQRKQRMIGLWVSRLDGSGMQEIGHMDYQPNDFGHRGYEPKKEVPQHLRWTPDGKRLSFQYQGALYTVPAN